MIYIWYLTCPNCNKVEGRVVSGKKTSKSVSDHLSDPSRIALHTDTHKNWMRRTHKNWMGGTHKNWLSLPRDFWLPLRHDFCIRLPHDFWMQMPYKVGHVLFERTKYAADNNWSTDPHHRILCRQP